MSIIFPPDVIYWAVTCLSLQTAWSWLMLVALSLLPPLLTVEALVAVVVTPLSSSPVQAAAGPRAGAWSLQEPGITLTSLLGGSEQALSQPRRLRSLARPLEVLVLDSEGLGHILPPEGVPALLVILPAHPERLNAAHLAWLGEAPTCCAPQVKDRRRLQVRSEQRQLNVYYFSMMMPDDLWSDWPVCVRSQGSVHVRVSHHSLLQSRPESERRNKSKANADGFSWINFNKTLIEILKN